MVRQNLFIKSIILVLCFSLSSLAFATEDLLPVNEAFQLSARVNSEKQEAQIKFKIKEGYHLYQEHLQVQTINNKPLTEIITLPTAIIKEDKLLGKYGVYENELSFNIPMAHISSGIRCSPW